MTIFQALLLGIVQGLTEFIPVSSSAHLIIVPWLMGWEDPALNSLAFDIALHIGTLVALMWYFARDWARLIRAGVTSVIERKIGDHIDRRHAWLLLIGSIPGGVAGVLFESKIEEFFHPPSARSMLVMAVVIAGLGLALYLADRLARHLREMKQVTLKDGIVIGVAQAFAIFPGVSRSGATISAGLAMGLTREAAARFSFLLSTPLIAGAGAKSLVTIFGQIRSGALSSSELILFPVGFIAAMISGYWCIKLLLRYLQTNSTNLFVYYRWLLAILLIVVALVRG